MFNKFIKKLNPLNSSENYEWEEILNDYENEFKDIEPTLFWYLSSGLDFKALVHFNEKDTSQVYKTPTIDTFIFSDYGGIEDKLEQFYENLDNGIVIIYRDEQTLITLHQLIPLRYFSQKEVENINMKYRDNKHSSFCNDKIISSQSHFYYCLIVIESNYFDEEYFPLLISPIENWVLMEEVWKKENIFFDYICGVCDGCRKGGAYKCVNVHFEDFIPIMKKTRKYWVSDHIHWKHLPCHNNFLKSFNKITELRGWGHYNSEKRGWREINVSYLYKIT